MTGKVEIVRQWYQDVWIDRKWDRMDELYRPANEEDCLSSGASTSASETREMVISFANLVTDQRIRIIHSIEKGEWVSALVEMYGFNAVTDEPIYMRWTSMVRIQDGRIVETYPSINFLSFFEQLGQLPKDSFELLLGGTILK